MIGVETMWMYLVTIALGVCFSVLTFYYVYLKIRPKFPIRVNCWFCNQYSVVPYDNRNCWDCVHCDQYNGFAGDGGYNKVIPAQHDELLNHSESAKVSKKGKGGAAKDALCRRCSINQQLKVQQLAAFSATNPNSFDQEVEEYRQHLERAYQLCSACERVLKQRLSQQQGWLLGLYRRELYSRKLQETSAGGAGHGGKALEGRWSSMWMWASCVLSLIPLPLAALLIGAHAHSLAPTMLGPFFSADALWLLNIVTMHEARMCVGGSVATAAAAAARVFRLYYPGSSHSGAAVSSVDVLAPMLWAAAAAHAYLLDTGALGEDVAVTDKALARLVLLVVVMAFNTVAAFHPQESFSTKSTTFPSRAHSGSKVNGKRHMTEIFNSPEPSERSSSSLSLPPHSLTVTCPVPASSTPSSSPSSSSPPPPSLLSPSYPSDAEELEWSLGRLRLGGGGGGAAASSPSVTVRSRRTLWGRRSTPAAFVTWSSSPATRTVTPVSTTLFRPAHLSLRHVTQASWVAGGYWGALGPPSPAPLSSSGNGSWAYGFVPRAGEARSPLTEASVGALSRCSSQSSGFHSRSSASPVCASASACGGASSDDGAASTSLPTPPANQSTNCLQRTWPSWWWSPAAAPLFLCPVAAVPQCGWPGGGSDASGGGSRRNAQASRTPSSPAPSSDGRSTAHTPWLLSPWLVVLSIACTFANAAMLCATIVAFKDRLLA